MNQHYQVLVIGGGNAGLSAAAYLLRKRPEVNVGIIEPSDTHYYQPAWTLVGGGVYDNSHTRRDEKDFIPKGAAWIQESASSFDPDQNKVVTKEGNTYTYDYLIVCPGIQLNWKDIKGLPESLGHYGVCSNYSFKTAPYTFECIQNYAGGKAIFHSSHTPVKCGGAPQKIMYLAADYFRKNKKEITPDIQFWSGGSKLFGVEKYYTSLLRVVDRYHIQLHFFQRLEEIDGPNKRARFVGIGPDNKNVETWVDYEFIHVTPPQGPPDFIRSSPLASAQGWVDVDKHTLQHVRYPNVFASGDASSLPTSRTGAAIRKQTPVMIHNLISLMEGKPMNRSYTGYTSCPIITGYGKLILAEFDYDNQPAETFPFDQSKERWSMYQLKRLILPRMYWNAILKGRMQG